MGDRQVNIDLTTWGLEERKDRVHFKLLRDAPMDKVVAINSDLVRGIISEMEGDGGDGEGSVGYRQALYNDLIGIYSNRVQVEGAWQKVI